MKNACARNVLRRKAMRTATNSRIGISAIVRRMSTGRSLPNGGSPSSPGSRLPAATGTGGCHALS
jgi:hypothetical protein